MGSKKDRSPQKIREATLKARPADEVGKSNDCLAAPQVSLRTVRRGTEAFAERCQLMSLGCIFVELNKITQGDRIVSVR